MGPEEPALPERLGWIWQAFWAVSSSRSSGWGNGPIPFEAVDCYARRYDLSETAFDTLWPCLREMDAVFLSVLGPKREGRDGNG